MDGITVDTILPFPAAQNPLFYFLTLTSIRVTSASIPAQPTEVPYSLRPPGPCSNRVLIERHEPSTTEGWLCSLAKSEYRCPAYYRGKHAVPATGGLEGKKTGIFENLV